MPKFRKKPVVIEAVQYLPGKTDSELILHLEGCTGWQAYSSTDAPFIAIPTLEGTMTALPGDWIIKGVKGEFYPCKPDIFAATYETAE